MILTKETVIDKIEILEGGSIQVRRASYILEDGVRISGPSYHRAAYSPGADITGEDAKVQAHATTAWTPEVVARHEAAIQAQEKA